MLAEDSDIASYRLFPSERAYDAVWEADACALCGAPELDRAASEHATFEWLGRHDAAFVRGDFEAEASEGEPFPGRSGSAAPKSWEDMRSRAANDSRLAAAYPWQHESTEAVLDGVIDSELERIAVDELLFPVCGRCFAVDEPIAAPVVRRAYVDFKFGGNAAVAAAQRQWPLVERFLDVLARIAHPRSA